jgi:UDP-glucose 4-epimerase
MNNWLITGGAGFIGQHLTDKLLTNDKTINVIIIDNLSNSENIRSNSPIRRKLNFNKGSVRFFKEDVRNKEALTKIIKDQKIDVCVHLAAKVSIPDSIRNPENTIDVNVRGTCILLEACSANRVRTLSLHLQLRCTGGFKPCLPVSEKHVIEPLSAYGASKVRLSYRHMAIQEGSKTRFP